MIGHEELSVRWFKRGEGEDGGASSTLEDGRHSGVARGRGYLAGNQRRADRAQCGQSVFSARMAVRFFPCCRCGVSPSRGALRLEKVGSFTATASGKGRGDPEEREGGAQAGAAGGGGERGTGSAGLGLPLAVLQG